MSPEVHLRFNENAAPLPAYLKGEVGKGEFGVAIITTQRSASQRTAFS
jgi:hypothetical protein